MITDTKEALARCGAWLDRIQQEEIKKAGFPSSSEGQIITDPVQVKFWRTKAQCCAAAIRLRVEAEGYGLTSVEVEIVQGVPDRGHSVFRITCQSIGLWPESLA